VLLVLGTPAGRTDLLCWSGLGLSTFSTDRSTPQFRPPQGHKGTCPRATPMVIHNSRRDRQNMQ